MWILVAILVGVLVAAAYIILILAHAYLHVRVELDAQTQLNTNLMNELERLHRRRIIVLKHRRKEILLPYEVHQGKRQQYMVGRN